MVMYTLSRAFHILFDLQIHQEKKLSNVGLKYLLANFGNGTNLSIIETNKKKNVILAMNFQECLNFMMLFVFCSFVLVSPFLNIKEN